MKKVIVYIIVIIFTFNLAGYYIGFIFLKYSIHYEVKKMILNNIDEKQITLIKLHKDDRKGPDFKMYEENEFRYKGSFYDIVRSKTINDTIYYYCINDKKESALFAKYEKYVNNNKDLTSSMRKKTKNILKYIIKDLFVKIPGKLVFSNSLKRQFVNICFFYTGYITGIQSPPP